MKKTVLIIAPFVMAMNSYAKSSTDNWKPLYERKKLSSKLLKKDSIEMKKRVKKEDKEIEVNIDTAAIKTPLAPMSVQPKNELESMFKTEGTDNKKLLQSIKNKVYALKNKSVPTLIKVMKSSDYPEKSRWWATFLLVKVMGDKAEAFVAKFYKHPAYFMRLAALKALHHLKSSKYKGLYAMALKDKSMIVRQQALQNIKDLKITAMAPSVWNMLYDKTNYNGDLGKLKRGSLIRLSIKTLGDLGFKKSKSALYKMISSKKFKDVHVELDYALEKLTGKKSPIGNYSEKAHFWSRQSLATTLIQ
jgi:hypothetical protein